MSLWRGRLMDFHHELACYVKELRARADLWEAVDVPDREPVDAVEIAQVAGRSGMCVVARVIADELERRFPAPVEVAEPVKVISDRESTTTGW